MEHLIQQPSEYVGLFELHPVLERIAHAVSQLVIPVMHGVVSNGVEFAKVYFSVLTENTFICASISFRIASLAAVIFSSLRSRLISTILSYLFIFITPSF